MSVIFGVNPVIEALRGERRVLTVSHLHSGVDPAVDGVTLSLPADFALEDATALYRGMQECAAAYDVTIGGGDIVKSPPLRARPPARPAR